MTRFEELLGAIKSKNIYIQTHNFPDPDAIASAYGLSNLLKSKNIDSTICYWGVIDRCNTAQMINALGITLLDSSTLPPLNSDDEVIFVDAQKGNSNISSHDVKLFSCIDHHPFGTETSYIFAYSSTVSNLVDTFTKSNSSPTVTNSMEPSSRKSTESAYCK